MKTHISGTVEKLVFNGLGLVRKEGFVIFVPHVLPQEEVTVQCIQRKKNFAHANVVEVIKKSPHRIEPLCPHFGQCGGCQLQHIDPTLHAEFKKGWLQEAFYGLYDKPIAFIPARTSFFWRRRISLHAIFLQKKWLCGYFSNDNVSLLEIEDCPLFFYPEEKKVLPFLRTLLGKIAPKEGSQIRIELFRLPSKEIAIRMYGNFSLKTEDRDGLLATLYKNEFFQKYSLEFGSWSRSREEDLSFEALGRAWFFSLDAFVQNHITQSELLWEDVVNIVHGIKETQVIFDLYAGIGVTAILLADKQHDVTAVEVSQSAISCGEKTCLNMAQKPLFICSTVEKFLQSTKKVADTWLINPPRTGLSQKVLQEILNKKPENIVYVSCSPATVARDIKHLVKEGWALHDVRGYDMFPQTTHLEIVGHLSRKPLSKS